MCAGPNGGNNARKLTTRDALWQLGFDPTVFKKSKQDQKAKGVDITFARDLLMHAVHDHYDVAVLIAGDGDYVPLVDEVKRLGKGVYVAFFSRCGLAQELARSSDTFFDLTNLFHKRWAEHQEHPTGT